MICHELKCIFIHIPKCAGTSIESALGHLDGHSGRGGQDHRSIRMLQRPILDSTTFSTIENIIELYRRIKHQFSPNITNPKNKITLTHNQYLDYFKFTVVRDPWDRAYSWYNNYIRDPEHETSGLSRSTSFHKFIQHQAGKGMLAPQLYWLKDTQGQIPMDYIARFENLESDFGYICKQLGIGEIELPHKIKGTDSNYRDKYDNDAMRIVEKAYKEEIRLFNYEF